MARTYHLFISHGWSYDDSFYRILDYLDEISNIYRDFEYMNHSEPEPEVPDLSYTRELKIEYEDQINQSDAVILLADLYREPKADESNLKFWLDYAIEHAKENNKTLLGIRPWNETQTPNEIENIPDSWVDWNPESIRKIIEKHL